MKPSLDSLFSTIDLFSNRRILVVGDVMLDEYIWGRVSRISPEAPVPIVDVNETTLRLGGAANVVQNLASVNITPLLIAFCGDDQAGEKLRTILEESGCDCSGLLVTTRPTTVKTRILAHSQQVVRIDRESSNPASPDETEQLLASIATLIDSVDGVIVSDYAKGVVSQALITSLIAQCSTRKIPLCIDPKEKNFHLYHGVGSLTPNLKEAYGALGLQYGRYPGEEEIQRIGWGIVKKYGLNYLLLTLSEHGMALFEDGSYTHLHTTAQEVYDVTGAGDTVISLFIASIATGASPIEATYIANFAAGITVREIGTASVTPEQLKEALRASL